MPSHHSHTMRIKDLAIAHEALSRMRGNDIYLDRIINLISDYLTEMEQPDTPTETLNPDNQILF